MHRLFKLMSVEETPQVAGGNVLRQTGTGNSTASGATGTSAARRVYLGQIQNTSDNDGDDGGAPLTERQLTR